MDNTINLHEVNIKEFVTELDNCKGNVYLTTKEGDKLNLKSTLCRMIGITRLIENGTISDATIECDLPEDTTRLFRFNLYGNKEK